MERKPPLIVLSGPTATGKSAWAIKLAQKFNGEVINFDSLLFYHELNIGTAKPTVEELEAVPHHLVGITSIKTPLNAHDFTLLAEPIIAQILEQKKIPILAGGSGFYLQALLRGMYDSITPSKEVLQRSEELYINSGKAIEPFRDILEKVDLHSFQKLHPNDHYRIRRAVEHFWATGFPFSISAQKRAQEVRELPWDILHIYLDIPKNDHFALIVKRTQQMLAQGLIDEVKDLLQKGFTGEERPLRSIGYAQVIQYLKGEIPSLLSCEEAITLATRQLAKAQRTWFKRVQDKTSLNPIVDQEKIPLLVANFIQFD